MTRPRTEFLSRLCYDDSDDKTIAELSNTLDILFNDEDIKIKEGAVAAMNLKDTVDLMLSDNYLDRLKAEYLQAKIRYDKLFNKLCEEYDRYSQQTVILERQLDIMREYINVLEDRLIHEARK